MKKSLAVETEENHRSTEAENWWANTPRRKSDPEIETSPSEAVTFEDVERQIRAITDPLTQQLAHLCELMKELRGAHMHGRHEETASSRAFSSSTGARSRFDILTGTLKPACAPLSTPPPPARLLSPELPHIREYSVLIMKTTNPLQTPNYRWIGW